MKVRFVLVWVKMYLDNLFMRISQRCLMDSLQGKPDQEKCLHRYTPVVCI